MFYAKEILSMETKTDISIIYYLSTTGNLRRINKNDIVKVNIKNTLTTILDQAYALRLYGFILKGISKIYVLKLKYYGNEINELLKLLKGKTIEKSKKKNALCYSSEENEEDIYDGEYNNPQNTNINNSACTINSTNIINYTNNTNNHLNCISNLDETCCLSFTTNLNEKIKKHKVIDDIIEDLSENNYYNYKKRKNRYKFVDIKNYPIFKLINLNEFNNSLEIYRNKTSSTNPSQIISDVSHKNLFNTSLDIESNNFSLVSNFCMSTEIEDLLKEGKFFNECVVGSRKTKSLMFYELLNLLSKDLVEVHQNSPDTDILIIKLNY